MSWEAWGGADHLSQATDCPICDFLWVMLIWQPVVCRQLRRWRSGSVFGALLVLNGMAIRPGWHAMIGWPLKAFCLIDNVVMILSV